MPRPKKNRWISCHPGITYYKPQGIPLRTLEQVFIGVDEFEAIRLADMEGLSQEDAADKMNISRPTFGRIVAEGRKKIAIALVEGKAIRIEGGEVELRPPLPPFGKGKKRFRRGGGYL
jgi:predicted DNA-binding protein (UPF0251 family)